MSFVGPTLHRSAANCAGPGLGIAFLKNQTGNTKARRAAAFCPSSTLPETRRHSCQTSAGAGQYRAAPPTGSVRPNQFKEFFRTSSGGRFIFFRVSKARSSARCADLPENRPEVSLSGRSCAAYKKGAYRFNVDKATLDTHADGEGHGPNVARARPECRYACISDHEPNRPRQIRPERLGWLPILGFKHSPLRRTGCAQENGECLPYVDRGTGGLSSFRRRRKDDKRRDAGRR